MSIFSWFLEFIGGSVFIVFYIFSIDTTEKGWTMFIPYDTFLYGILIPSSYLLKSDSVKNTVISNGWLAPFIEPLQSLFECLMFDGLCCCKANISPVEEIDLLEIPNANLFRAAAPPPITTISRKIEKDLRIEDI